MAENESEWISIGVIMNFILVASNAFIMYTSVFFNYIIKSRNVVKVVRCRLVGISVLYRGVALVVQQ